jgi:Ras-related protein Rab-6A
LFIETSAKAGYNVKALFRKIAQALPGMDVPTTEESKSQSTYIFRLVDVYLVIDVKLNQNTQVTEQASSCNC